MRGPRSVELPSEMQASKMPVSEMRGPRSHVAHCRKHFQLKKPFQTDLGPLISDRKFAGGCCGYTPN